jgi:hypothetical protein
MSRLSFFLVVVLVCDVLGCSGFKRSGERFVLPKDTRYEELWDALLESLHQWDGVRLSANRSTGVVQFKTFPAKLTRRVLSPGGVWNRKPHFADAFPGGTPGWMGGTRIQDLRVTLEDGEDSFQLSVYLDCERPEVEYGQSDLDRSKYPPGFRTRTQSVWHACPCPYAEQRAGGVILEGLRNTLGAPAFVFGLGEFGAWEGGFDSPFDLAVDKDGFIYVSESELHRIMKFSPDGTLVAAWADSGSQEGKLSGPKGLAVTGEGNVYVADSGNGRVQAFTPDGLFYGTPVASLTRGEEIVPIGVALAESSIFVLDESGPSIVVYDRSGTKRLSLGEGEGLEALENGVPTDMAMDRDGRLLVLYGKERCIAQFVEDGTLITMWDKASYGGDALSRNARSLAVDSKGNVYVAELDHVKKFDERGVLVDFCCEPGVGYGRFKAASAIAIGPADEVYVLDTFNRCIQRLE